MNYLNTHAPTMSPKNSFGDDIQTSVYFGLTDM